MADATITVSVDEMTAQAFAAASTEEQGKLRLLLALRLRELTGKPRKALNTVMDEIGKHAEAQGLTPEVLESLLHDL